MKRLLLLCVALLALSAVQAQRVYFIYLQSDAGLPFFVKMGDKVFSSSAGGYLILPRLTDSTYTFSVGRPGQQTPEPRFAVTIRGGDKGFLLKNMENGLSLFDLQTLALQTPLTNNAGSVAENSTRRTDAFTKLLSEAADDTSLLTVPVLAKEDKKAKTEKPTPEKKETVAETRPAETQPASTETAETKTAAVTQSNTQAKTNEPPTTKPQEQPVAAKPEKEEAVKNTTTQTNPTPAPDTDTTTITRTETTAEMQPQINAAEETPYKRSVVTRRSESSTSEGFGLVFLDNQDGKIDTIRILIPNPTTIFSQPEPEEQKEEPVTMVVRKPVCPAVATNNDFMRLRRDMAAKAGDNNMIDEARKVFRRKCFTTEQIRNLSTLFLTDEGKYNFFDAAYRFVSDPSQFPTLEGDLRNENYVKRFKALVANSASPL